MPKFTFTAIKEGKTLTSTVEASSEDVLKTTLAKQGARLIAIKADRSQSLLSRFKKPKKIKLKDLVIFTRQLSTMISAGVPLTRSLTTLEQQADNKYFRTVISGITKDVEGGMPLGEAFSKYPRIFSDVYVNMVRAGEAGGILDEILKRLATQVEQDSSTRKKIKSAMTYPVVILSITVVAFFGIMIFIIPKLSKILSDLGGPNAKLPIYTQMLVNLSTFMQKYAVFIAVIVFVAIYFLRRYLRTPKGKFKRDSLILKTPIIKDIITKIAIARFSRTFASLMSAGVSVLDSLDVTGGAIGNKVIEKELKEAAKAVKNGQPLSQPLSTSKHFPPIVGQMLAVGEETGQIDTILIKVADFYEEEVSTVIDSMSSIIEPLMIIILGSMVGLIAASVMGPIASLSKNIGNN